MTGPEHGSEAWLAERRSYLGASEVPSILRIPGAHQAPYDIWRAKRGLAEPQADTPVLATGRALEPALLAWAALHLGIRSEYTGLMRHPQVQCVAGHPDAWDGVDGVECKAVLYGDPVRSRPRWEAQCQVYMAITGAESWHLVWARPAGRLSLVDAAELLLHPSAAVLTRTCEVGHEVYWRDRRWDHELERVALWWDRHVIGGVRPEIDESPVWPATLAEEYPDASGELREDEGAIWAIEDYHAWGERATEAQAQRAAAKHRILQSIGGDRGICGSWGTATWSRASGRLTVRRSR